MYVRGLGQPPFVVSVDVPAAPKTIRYEINFNDLSQTNIQTGGDISEPTVYVSDPVCVSLDLAILA